MVNLEEISPHDALFFSDGSVVFEEKEQGGSRGGGEE
jgi:hypothetical protein